MNSFIELVGFGPMWFKLVWVVAATCITVFLYYAEEGGECSGTTMFLGIIAVWFLPYVYGLLLFGAVLYYAVLRPGQWLVRQADEVRAAERRVNRERESIRDARRLLALYAATVEERDALLQETNDIRTGDSRLARCSPRERG